jgi:hypothetical protein
MHMELYKHLFEGFANPAVLQKDDAVKYDEIKKTIIDYESAFDPAYLKRDRARLTLYNKEHKEKQKNLDNRDTGDTTKAFGATENNKANWRNRKMQHSEDKHVPVNKVGGPLRP